MKKKILIIDDEIDFTEMIKGGLESIGGYEVRVENRGANGLKAAQEFKPDLILLDIIIPDMDGGDITNQLMSDDSLKDTPIIYITGAVTKEEMGSQYSVVGGRTVITKPIAIKELIKLIKENIK